MKRITKITAASFASALLILSMTPFSASAETLKSGDYSYEVQGGEVVIVRYVGEDENILVPSTIDGKKVTQIGTKAFEMYSDIVSVEIPDGVTKIGDHAFAIDVGLETITLPATLKEIDEYAFQQCSSLQTVNFAGDESAWSSITIGSENELLTAITPTYNASLTPQSDETSSGSSEDTSSEEASSEETSSAEASSEETSSAEDSSEETSSAETSSADSSSETVSNEATTTGTASTETTSSEEPVPQGSSTNPALVVGGILVGIAILDIIYFSINKPKEPSSPDTK